MWFINKWYPLILHSTLFSRVYSQTFLANRKTRLITEKIILYVSIGRNNRANRNSTRSFQNVFIYCPIRRRNRRDVRGNGGCSNERFSIGSYPRTAFRRTPRRNCSSSIGLSVLRLFFGAVSIIVPLSFLCRYEMYRSDRITSCRSSCYTKFNSNILNMSVIGPPREVPPYRRAGVTHLAMLVKPRQHSAPAFCVRDLHTQPQHRMKLAFSQAAREQTTSTASSGEIKGLSSTNESFQRAGSIFALDGLKYRRAGGSFILLAASILLLKSAKLKKETFPGTC